MGRFVVTLGDVEQIAQKVAQGFWSIVEAAGENELAQLRLATAMKAQGIYSKEAFDQNVQFAESMQAVTR